MSDYVNCLNLGRRSSQLEQYKVRIVDDKKISTLNPVAMLFL